MTTFEPGASDVFTHGLDFRPFATALRASSPAPSMTLGFDVFVQLVIAAMTTWPWSSSVSVPSPSVTATLCDARVASATWSWAACGSGWPSPPLPGATPGGSLAGNDCAESSSSATCSSSET